MSAALPLTGVVIAQDEADRIGRCLDSLARVCADVVVLDSGSKDATVAVARAAGARVEHQPWLGFAGQKNAAIARATQPWVLLLDADEWLDDAAPARLRALFASGEVERADVWTLPRRMWFLGRPLDHGGLGREPVQRLFRARLRYRDAEVHEALDTAGARVDRVDARIEHATARSLDEQVRKQARYAELAARQAHARGRRAGALSAPLHAFAYWLRAYVVRGGFLDGRAGWIYHLSHARYVHRKYVVLRGLCAGR